MSEIGGERIEPTPRVIEPQGTDPRGQPDSGSRLRQSSVPEERQNKEEDEDKERDPEIPVHQVDRRA